MNYYWNQICIRFQNDMNVYIYIYMYMWAGIGKLEGKCHN